LSQLSGLDKGKRYEYLYTQKELSHKIKRIQLIFRLCILKCTYFFGKSAVVFRFPGSSWPSEHATVFQGTTAYAQLCAYDPRTYGFSSVTSLDCVNTKFLTWHVLKSTARTRQPNDDSRTMMRVRSTHVRIFIRYKSRLYEHEVSYVARSQKHGQNATTERRLTHSDHRNNTHRPCEPPGKMICP